MLIILNNKPGIQYYLDDVTVFGKTPEAHEKNPTGCTSTCQYRRAEAEFY